VIAIISVIAAILFPVFAQAREKARAAMCVSNERQLGLAFMQYAQDCDEILPIGASGDYGGVFSGWAGPLFPYVKNEHVYQCPDDARGPLTRILNG